MIVDVLRSYFLIYYAIGLAIILLKTLNMLRATTPSEYQPSGPRRYLPLVLIPLQFFVPPIAIFFRLGEIDAEWIPVRLIGFALSVYAAVVSLWAVATLGRFLVPRAVVFEDHRLVTDGPYRLVRHPVYSGNLTLLLGTALATLNLVVLASLPIAAFGFSAEARVEEELLESKFGEVYRAYARRAGRFVPRA